MKYIVLIFIFFNSCFAFADELEEGKIYRLNKSISNIESVDRSTGEVFKDSKFVLIDASRKDYYLVRFTKLYDNKDILPTVTVDREYKLLRTIDTVPVEKSVVLSRGGMVSGPLIVPFKYRLDDDSLSGEAAIGYYAGYSFEKRIGYLRVPITPFLAGGLSQVAVKNDDEIKNQTGVTLAAGILIQNWAGVNIGLVYGQDRIGDKTWQHEGEGWVSVMVGWEL